MATKEHFSKSNLGRQVDAHKVWLIAGIVIVLVALGVLFLYPSLKEKAVAGKAYSLLPADSGVPAPRVSWSWDNLDTHLVRKDNSYPLPDIMVLSGEATPSTEPQRPLSAEFYDDNSVVATGNDIRGYLRPGVARDGLGFDGNLNLRVPGSSVLNPTRKVSIEFWMKAEEFESVPYVVPSGSIVYLGDIGGTAPKWAYFIKASDSDGDGVDYRLEVSTSHPTDASSSLRNMFSYPGEGDALKVGQWYHVVVVINQVENIGYQDVSKGYIYINGVRVTEVDIASRNMYNVEDDEKLYIGRRGGSSIMDFKGRLDELAIYPDVALTPSQVSKLAHGGDPVAVRGCSVSGLVSSWGGDFNTLDKVGNNPGEIAGASTESFYVGTGKVGSGSFYFADVTGWSRSYVEVPDSSDLSLDTVATMTAWVNPRGGVDEDYDSIINKWGDEALSNEFIFGLMRDRKLGFKYKLGTSLTTGMGSVTSTSTLPNDNDWHHVAVVRDESAVRFYIDGALAGGNENALGPTLTSSGDASLRIGAQARGESRYFKGFIDEVQIYDRALTANEVRAVYSSTVGDPDECITCNAGSREYCFTSTDCVGAGGRWVTATDSCEEPLPVVTITGRHPGGELVAVAGSLATVRAAFSPSSYARISWGDSSSDSFISSPLPSLVQAHTYSPGRTYTGELKACTTSTLTGASCSTGTFTVTVACSVTVACPAGQTCTSGVCVTPGCSPTNRGACTETNCVSIGQGVWSNGACAAPPLSITDLSPSGVISTPPNEEMTISIGLSSPGYVDVDWGDSSSHYLSSVSEGVSSYFGNLAHTYGSAGTYTGSVKACRSAAMTGTDCVTQQFAVQVGAASVCGNGEVEGTEQCDDGNTVLNDGCGREGAPCLFTEPTADWSCTPGLPCSRRCSATVACPAGQSCNTGTGLCEVTVVVTMLGDYNTDNIASTSDAVKFNWHVLFGDLLLGQQQTYAGDSCGAVGEFPCPIGDTNRYICDSGKGLAANANTACPQGSLLGDYNGDGIISTSDAVKFNWHVLFGDLLLGQQQTYASDSCGAVGEFPCPIGDTNRYVCDSGKGLASNAGTRCS